MPTSEKQRRAAYAELNRRRRGGKSKMFKGMKTSMLDEYAHKPLEKRPK